MVPVNHRIVRRPRQVMVHVHRPKFRRFKKLQTTPLKVWTTASRSFVHFGWHRQVSTVTDLEYMSVKTSRQGRLLERKKRPTKARIEKAVYCRARYKRPSTIFGGKCARKVKPQPHLQQEEQRRRRNHRQRHDSADRIQGCGKCHFQSKPTTRTAPNHVTSSFHGCF